MKWLYGFAWLSVCIAAGASGNLWQNPGFESWDAAKNLPSPAAWRWLLPEKTSRSFAIFERSGAEKHSGAFSLHLKDDSTGKVNHTLIFCLAPQETAALAGKTLYFSAWVKQRAASAADGVGIGISVNRQKGPALRVAVATGTTEATAWMPLLAKLKLPDDADQIFVSLHCANGWGRTGEAFFDDLYLGTTPPDDRAAAPKAEPPRKNTNPNPVADSAEQKAYRESWRTQPPTLDDGYVRPEIRNGTWFRDGKPVFYLGGWLYNRTHIDWGPHANPLNIDHVGYKLPPGKKLFQAMGFNSAQISAAHQNPGIALYDLPLPNDWKTADRRMADFFTGFGDEPLVLDFAFGFHRAVKQVSPAKYAELDQRNGKWHEFLPFCPEHPDGARYYQAYLSGGVKAAMRNHANIFLYELFNESSYNCQCRYNARDFAGRMAKKYGDIARANRVWGTIFDSFDEVARQTGFAQYPKLWPDWCKFSAARYAEILTQYKQLIRSIDRRKQVYFTEQGVGLPPAQPGMDYRLIADVLDVLALEGGWQYGFATDFEAANEMEAVVAASGGKHFFNCDFYRALAKNRKPVVNDEHYCTRLENGIRVPSRREDMITSLWTELFHGVSGNFTYVWDKRSFDWRTREQAKRNVLTPSYKSSSLLNPYNWPPDQLDAFQRFRDELAPYEAELLPMPRTKPATVAVFFSYPTLRMSEISKQNYIRTVTDWYVALLHAQLPVKVVFEEDLASGLGKEVEALVFPGNRYADPETLRGALAFQQRGGMVVASPDAFQMDEYGNPLAGAETLARCTDAAEAIRRALARPVTRYAVPEPVDGGAKLRTADVQVIDRGDRKFVFAVNRGDVGSRLVRLRLQVTDAGTFYVQDLVNKRVLAGEGGVRWTREDLARGVLLRLPSQERVLLLLSRTLPERHTSYDEAAVRREFEAVRREEAPRIAALAAAKEKTALAREARIFRDVNPAKCVPLDLTHVVNMHFRDEVAGDRKGGWFDQGANDFAQMPLGEQRFANVPFRIIDPDKNNGKGVLVLWGSHRDFFPKEATGIRVDRQVRALYFLHTMGWTGDLVLTYRIHYADGTQIDVPVRGEREITGWWGVRNLPNAKIAVESGNAEKDKINMQCFRWINPRPEQKVLSLDIISAACEALPAVAAITAEEP